MLKFKWLVNTMLYAKVAVAI